MVPGLLYDLNSRRSDFGSADLQDNESIPDASICNQSATSTAPFVNDSSLEIAHVDWYVNIRSARA